MLLENLATALLGLTAALTWGAGDFSGGLATRRGRALGVIAAMYAVGLVLLAAGALVTGEAAPSGPDLLWSGAAGLSGAIGLAALYRAFARGKMGFGAMVAAALAVTMPVVFGALTEGLPGTLKLVGFAVAIGGLALLSGSARDGVGASVLLPAVVAGLGFGGFFIMIDQVQSAGVFWSLVAARGLPFVLMVLIGLLRGGAWLPGPGQWRLVALAGVFDVGGNIFFVLAARSGRLDVSVVMSSLYPAFTVLLARAILGERMTRLQTLGMAACALTVPMIAV